MILGHKSQIFIGKEATYGATPTYAEASWYDCELYARPGSRPRKTSSTSVSPFITGGYGISSSSFIKGKYQVDGGYSLYLATHGMHHLLYMATGDADADGDTEEASGTIEIGTITAGVDNIIPSCSILHAFQETNAEFEGTLYNGMMLNQLSISCGGEDSLAEMTVGFLGKNEVWVDASDDIAVANLEQPHKPGEYFIGWKSRLQIGGTHYPFYDFSMSLNNNLTFPDFIQAGVLSQDKPERSTLRDVSGSFTLALEGESTYDGILNDMFNATQKTIQMQFFRYDDQITNGSPSESFTINFPKAIILGDGSPGSIDAGLLRIPVSFRATSGNSTIPTSEVTFTTVN